MNQPVPYQSQIIVEDDQITINLASALRQFLDKYFFAITLLSYPISYYIGISLDNMTITMFPLVILLFCYLIIYLLPSDILINQNIADHRQSIVLTNIPYLDIEAQTVGNEVKIKLGDFNFKLKNATDLPILLDAIVEKGNLEFYENYQLSNNTQVVTFKGKHIAKPSFSTFLIVQNTAKKLRISDITNQASWFEILKNNAIQIKFSSLADVNLTTQMLDIKAISSLKIVIKRKRVELIANDSIIIYQSYIRKKKVELTNLRDGEKVYDLLTKLPSLSNIKIEKVMINS
ncbi:MAG: hypothetical protein AB8G11_18605 [Saprospiraceae bacterium]